jgi:hypothetical protein
VEIYNSTGGLSWTFNVGAGTYLVDSARHLETGSSGSAVDTFAVFMGASGGSTLYGLTSTSVSAKPSWLLTLPDCGTDTGGGTYIGLQASDSGSAVAFLCHYTASSGAVTARAYLINGQTGAVSWYLDLGASVKAGQGDSESVVCGG